MRKIGLLLSTEPYYGGAFQYTREVLTAVCGFPHTEVYAFCYHKAWKEYLSRYPVHAVFVENVRNAYLLGQKIDQVGCDLLFLLNDIRVLGYLSTPTIAVIHDLMHIYERGHGFDEVEANHEYEQRQIYFHLIYEHATAILSESRLGKQHIVEQYGSFHEDKIYILPFSVPSGFPKKSVDDLSPVHGKYIFYPAQLWKHKNHANLVKAMHILRKKGLDIHMVFAGTEKNGKKNLESLVKDLHLEDRITWLGYVSDEEIYALYRHARAMMMPSFFGPTNIPPLEAMALGCPVAVANNYAMPEQVGDAGLTFPPDDVDAIAEVMERLWTDDALCQEMSRKGQARSRFFTFEQFAARLKNIVDMVIDAVQSGERKLHELCCFCEAYHSIYLYGAGNYGQKLCLYLLYHHIPIKGFLVTEYPQEEKTCMGFPVHGIRDAKIMPTDGIVLSLHASWHDAVMNELDQCHISHQDRYALTDQHIEELEKFLLTDRAMIAKYMLRRERETGI